MKFLDGNNHYILDAQSAKTFTEISNAIKNRTFDGSIKIPNNWQVAGINNFHGTVWFVKPFRNKKPCLPLSLLVFHGVDYFCEAWLNNKYLGSHEGYFQKFYFNISGLLKHNNLLIVKVTSPKEPPGSVWPDKKKLIKGIFNHHDCRPGGWNLEHGQDLNTGGIWNRIEIVKSDKIFIIQTQIISKLNRSYTKATVSVKVNLQFPTGFKTVYKKIELEILSPSGKKSRKTFEVKFMPNKFVYKFSLVLSNPELWSPWDIGKPQLYTLRIKSNAIEYKEIKIGIREVKLDNNRHFIINGKKLFLRGTNIIPAQYLSELTNKRINKIVRLLKEANINIVRIHAHINRKELYEKLDKAGIMVWQDFSLQWTYDASKEFERNAISQVGDMVSQLYNHPSIVVWCCHNEPGEQVNTLDKKLFAEVKKLDDTRIIRQASNYEEHAYEGWYWGKIDNYISTPKGPLVTEFGAQAIPYLDSLKKIIPSDKLFPPNLFFWEYHNFQPNQTFNVAKIKTGKSINEFIRNSQEYQYNLLKTAIHYYRRKKNENITGIFQFMFVDSWRSITWSVVDYYLKKKKGYFAIKNSYKPLLLSVYMLQDQYFPSSKLNCEIWLINDTINKFKQLKIRVKLSNRIIGEINDLEIDANDKLHLSFEEIKIILPANLWKGKHFIKFLLYNSSNNLIDKDEFMVLITKKNIEELIEK